MLSRPLLPVARWIRRNEFRWTRQSTLRAFVLGVAVAPVALLALDQARLPDIRKTTQEAAERIGLGVQADAEAAVQDRPQAASASMTAGPDPALAALDTMFPATSAADADASPGRQDFRNALLATSPDSLARRLYQRVDGDGVRLRSAPSESSAVLRRTERDAYVRLEGQFVEGNWCHVRLAEGREGWMKCDFLRPIVSVHAPRWE
jgi:hypothetical protein